MAVLVHHEHADPVAIVEQFGGRRIGRHAHRIAAHRLQPLQPPVEQGIGHGGADASVILMDAHAFDFHRAIIEEKALRGIETNRAEADRDLPQIDHGALAQHAHADGVERRRLDRPQFWIAEIERQRGIDLVEHRHAHRDARVRHFAAIGVDQRGLDRYCRRCALDIAERRHDGHLPAPRGIAARIAMHTVADDRDRRAAHQPGVAVEPGAFIPPAFPCARIDADRDDIGLVSIGRERRDVGMAAGIA